MRPDDIADDFAHLGFLRGEIGLDAALTQYHDAVSHLEHVIEAMADENDRDPLLPHLADELQHALDLAHRQCRRRLVHDDELGIEGERPGNGDGLLLAAREHADRAVNRRNARPETFDHPQGVGIHFRLVDKAWKNSEGPLHRFAAEENVGGDVLLLGQRQILVDHLDAALAALAPGERRARGIEMIYQDLALARQQDVAANIFLGREPVKRPLGFLPPIVDKSRMDAEARQMIDRLGARIPSIHRPVGMFSGGQQQTVAIARALTFAPKLVIMDEPTAALAVREVESVLALIAQMRTDGLAVILISHRLNDVFEATDRIVVLRQGRIEADLATKQTQMREVVSYIVGAH